MPRKRVKVGTRPNYPSLSVEDLFAIYVDLVGNQDARMLRLRFDWETNAWGQLGMHGGLYECDALFNRN